MLDFFCDVHSLTRSSRNRTVLSSRTVLFALKDFTNCSHYPVDGLLMRLLATATSGNDHQLVPDPVTVERVFFTYSILLRSLRIVQLTTPSVIYSPRNCKFEMSGKVCMLPQVVSLCNIGENFLVDLFSPTVSKSLSCQDYTINFAICLSDVYSRCAAASTQWNLASASSFPVGKLFEAHAIVSMQPMQSKVVRLSFKPIKTFFGRLLQLLSSFTK